MKEFKDLMIEGIISKASLLMFANSFRKKFVDWDSYKLGIIDEKGNIIKKPVTKEEKSSMDGMTNIVRKIKRLLVRYMGDSKIANYMIAAYLLKSESVHPEQSVISNEIDKILTEDELTRLTDMLFKLSNE